MSKDGIDQRALPPPRVLKLADLAKMLDIDEGRAADLLARRVFHGVQIDGEWFISREGVVGRIEELSDAGVTIKRGEHGPVLLSEVGEGRYDTH